MNTTSATDELLNTILWYAELFKRPSYQHLAESYESWAYRHKLHWQLNRLQKNQLVKHDGKPPLRRRYTLSQQGRIRVFGGRDPDERWGRTWDGQWRWVSFDVPEVKKTTRRRLRTFLHHRQFGKLQKSLWITPDPIENSLPALHNFAQGPTALLVVQGRPISGASNQDIVAAAWNFAQINQAYEECLRILEKFSAPAQIAKAHPATLRQWLRYENEAWLAAVAADPLLPSVLLPQNYLGKQIWQKRLEILPLVVATLD